jgi:hypothetical protein
LDDVAIAARALGAGIRAAPLSELSPGGNTHAGPLLGYGRITERDLDAAAAALEQRTLLQTPGAQTGPPTPPSRLRTEHPGLSCSDLAIL